MVKNNDILKFACKWMEVHKTILSEATQTKKDEHGMNLFSEPHLQCGYTFYVPVLDLASIENFNISYTTITAIQFLLEVLELC